MGWINISKERRPEPLNLRRPFNRNPGGKLSAWPMTWERGRRSGKPIFAGKADTTRKGARREKPG
jgi:hypothetical protein